MGYCILPGQKRYVDYSPIDELAAKTILRGTGCPEEKFYIDGESKSEIEWNKLPENGCYIDEAKVRLMQRCHLNTERFWSRHGIFGARNLCEASMLIHVSGHHRGCTRLRKAMVDLRVNCTAVKPDEEAMHEC